METVSIQVLKAMGRWFVFLMLLSQPAFSQEVLSSSDNSVWHNALFIFCICFFIAGFIFMFMVKTREEKKHRRHMHHRLSHRN